MILLNTPEMTSNAITIGTVLTTSGAIMGILIAVLRDLFKRQSEMLNKQLQEIHQHLSELRAEIKDTNNEHHRLDKRMVRVEAVLAANGCLSNAPKCDQTN